MSQHSKVHNYDIQDERKQFQLERLILFSDAVFAIAITLLVIEIRVPSIENSTDATKDIKSALGHMLPEFFGFILSFAVIGQFWTSHHKLFGYVKNYNNGLLWMNLLFLFWVVLVPFTSGLNSRYGNVNFVWMIYCLNLFCISVSLILLFMFVGNAKRNLSDLVTDKTVLRFSIIRSILVASIFLAAALFTIPNNSFCNYLSRFILFLIPVVISITNRRQNKILKKNKLMINKD
ncbi:MAG: TMEM175 family protein [Ferruginibacter sp.]